MFAKEIEMKLVDDLNETAVVELNAADVDDVSGGIVPIIIAIAAASFAAGYAAGRKSR